MLSTGVKSKPHISKCRHRMYDELNRTEKGRKWMGKTETRINEALEEKVKGDHEENDQAERRESSTQGSEVAASGDVK